MSMDAISNNPEHPYDPWASIELVRVGGEDGAPTLPEQIAARVAEAIEAGELPPGSRLPSERELARIFGVSRLAVREASHRLEARGLVVVRRGAGSYVSAVVAREAPAQSRPPVDVAADELVALRMLVEPAAADWAARRADGSSVRVLRRIAQQFASAATDSEPRYELLVAADVELHLEIARGAENELLTYVVGLLQSLARVELDWSLRRPGRPAETAREHLAIVEAIGARDPFAARKAMAAHLARAASPREDAEPRYTLD
jgi:GntR family transcriptional regulator, transcriptional repressor for pyruvate dehydrogenase complex